MQKPEGFRVKSSPKEKVKIEASSRKAGASEGEVVVFYFEPSATQSLKSSGFPDVLGRSRRRSPKGEQHGKTDPILRIHQWSYPGICHFAMISVTNVDHYLIFAMLFMQLRGLCNYGVI